MTLARLSSEVRGCISRERTASARRPLLKALLARSNSATERILYLPQELDAEQVQELRAEVLALERETRGRIMSILAALGVDPDRILGAATYSPGESAQTQTSVRSRLARVGARFGRTHEPFGSSFDRTPRTGSGSVPGCTPFGLPRCRVRTKLYERCLGDPRRSAHDVNVPRRRDARLSGI